MCAMAIGLIMPLRAPLPLPTTETELKSNERGGRLIERVVAEASKKLSLASGMLYTFADMHEWILAKLLYDWEKAVC